MSVTSEPSMESALHVGECYQRIDDVQNAIESYNSDTTWKKKSFYRQCTHNKVYRADGSYSKMKQHKQKMCHSCIAYNKSQRCSDNALKLTKAYMSLLNKLDEVKINSVADADRDLIDSIVQLNDQMYHINSVLLQKTGSGTYFHQEEQQQKDTLSLDALEAFLGNLMEEATVLEKQSNLKDTKKHKMVMPLLNRIGKMISDYPTKQFLSYHEHLGKLEAAIRVSHRGKKENTLRHIEIVNNGYYSSNENLFRPIKEGEYSAMPYDSMEDEDSNFESASVESEEITSSSGSNNGLETEV